VVSIHVLPRNDLIEHERPGDDCVCGPDVKFAEDGIVVIVHHALDGRKLPKANTLPREEKP
jgi:hypothetical protein